MIDQDEAAGSAGEGFCYEGRGYGYEAAGSAGEGDGARPEEGVYEGVNREVVRDYLTKGRNRYPQVHQLAVIQYCHLLEHVSHQRFDTLD